MSTGTFYYQFTDGTCVDLHYKSINCTWSIKKGGKIYWSGRWSKWGVGVVFKTFNRYALEKLWVYLIMHVLTRSNIDSLVDSEKRIPVIIPDNLLLGIKVSR